MNKRIPVILVLFLVAGASIAGAGDIYTLISQGKLREAADSLSLQSSVALRDGRLLFYQSMLEQDGAEAAQLLEAARNATVPARFQEDLYLRLVQYYLIKGDQPRMCALINEYRARWETGKYEDHMFRLSILADQMTGDYESALRQVDRYLLRYSKGEKEQWGKIDKARVLRANNKGIGAARMLRTLSRAKDGAGVALALYLLALDAVEGGRTDDAVFYYNLLREEYPEAVGIDYLVDRLSGMSAESPQDTRAEELTRTFYAIKVGVFSNKSNAKNQAKLFESYDMKTDIEAKKISGKKYHVVYVGRFSTFEDARRFKAQLESTHGEAYQVVAR